MLHLVAFSFLFKLLSILYRFVLCYCLYVIIFYRMCPLFSFTLLGFDRAKTKETDPLLTPLHFISRTFHLRFPVRDALRETTHSFRNPMTSLLFRGLFNVFYFASEQVRSRGGPFYLRPMKGNANSFLSGLNYFVVIWLCCCQRGKEVALNTHGY